jgi:hypothetical protein
VVMRSPERQTTYPVTISASVQKLLSSLQDVKH